MIKIKNLIFPETELEYLYSNESSKRLHIKIKGQKEEIIFTNILVDDIQWNYEKEIETIREIYNKIQQEKRKIKEPEKDNTFEHLFNTLNGRCKRLIDYVDDLKDSKLINVNIAKNIKGIIQNGF